MAPTPANSTSYLQQGRIVLRVTPTYVSGNFFIQAQVELVGNQCQTSGAQCLNAGVADTDDFWIRLGQWNVWDFKFGRFEGWELYHTGMGLDINTLERLGAITTDKGNNPLQPPLYYDYGASYLHDRPAGVGEGYLAFHWFPLEYLRFEVLGALGADQFTSNNVQQSGGHNIIGGRPSGILDLGWLKLKGATSTKGGRGPRSS